MDPSFEQDFDAAFDFRATLTPETDRGCALMAAAYLDTRLADCLALYFVDDSQAVESLLGPDRPLSTFSSRIDAAYLFGLISPDHKRALHLIRKIRNEFGHDPKPLSFDDQAIAGRCKNLEDLGFSKRGTHRAMFTGAVMIVLAALNVRLRTTKHCEPRPNVNVARRIEEDPDLRVLKALADFLAATPEEKDRATAELQAACEALLGGEGRKEFAAKIVAHIAKRASEQDR